MRFIRPKEVLDLVGISRTTLWRLCRSGTFPKPIRITPGRSAFHYEAVQEWMERRLNPSDLWDFEVPIAPQNCGVADAKLEQCDAVVDHASKKLVPCLGGKAGGPPR